METHTTENIFVRLKSGETIFANDPQAYKMREASFATKKLLIRMNNVSGPKEIIVTAGAVVSKDVPDNVAAGGILAKILKTI